ncbi:MAG: alkyl hydroperoxide reductase/Thiol specific antioxidant/Mal allergen [Flavipsychrobacter sp.]|jgi:peroxiredoxin|nr:alkyl hydroperoxide reductase/Thiol specific antioxidant/Mal allergen [Flavipsychrobacter sp.]
MPKLLYLSANFRHFLTFDLLILAGYRQIPWMKSRQLLFLLIGISFFAACSSDSHRFKVIGNIAGMPGQTVILEQLNANDVINIIDSQTSNEDGHFELSGVAPEPGLYRLHFGQNKFILLSVDNGNIKIDADWNTLEQYKVSGSAPSEDLKKFIVSIREHLRDFNTMSIVLDSLRMKGNDSLLTVAQNDFADMRQQFTQFVEHYADTNPYEPNAIFAARMLNPATEKHYLEAFHQSLNRRFPNAKMTKEYSEFYAKVKAKQNQPERRADNGTEKNAPEVSLPDKDGNIVSLSSFRGKYVLLDFWASWCGPCRGENPNVVAAYEKYKGKNFTILSVSLDSKKDAWLEAVQEDGLTWTQVSDLNGWDSPAAATYGVHSIPTNFLIDTSGKIIAHNLRGPQLEEKLGEILK